MPAESPGYYGAPREFNSFVAGGHFQMNNVKGIKKYGLFLDRWHREERQRQGTVQVYLLDDNIINEGL